MPCVTRWVPPVAHLPATFSTDMIQGEELAFDLESIKVADTDFVCLHIVGPTAQVWCRWETDANAKVSGVPPQD